MEQFITDEPHPRELWDETLPEALFLVLTNFALLPVITRLVRTGDWATAGNFFGVLIASSAYHMCRAGVLCLFDYPLLRIGDYLFVYRALVWAIASLVARPRVFGPGRALQVRAAFHFVFMIPVSLIILGSEHNDIWIPVAGFVLPLAIAVVVSLSLGERFVNDWRWGGLAISMFVIGAILGFCVGAEVYNWAHSLWHAFVMMALYAFVRATE